MVVKFIAEVNGLSQKICISSGDCVLKLMVFDWTGIAG